MNSYLENYLSKQFKKKQLERLNKMLIYEAEGVFSSNSNITTKTIKKIEGK